MGVPVAARNIFPSNIQGLPTWYEVRVVEDGWRGRRGGVDLMVAMNPQTWDKDVAEIDAGGYLFYDSTKPLPPSRFRDDVTSLGIPADRHLQRRIHRRPPAAAVQEHHLSRRAVGAARHRAGRDREALRRAVQGQGSAARIEPQGVPHGPRLRARALRMPAADPRQAQRPRRRPHLHRRQQRGGARQRVRRRHRGRVVSDHAVVVARRSVHELLPQVPHRSGDQARSATRSCRPRTSSRRSAW